MTNQSEQRAFVWQACTAIRNEHRDVKKYVEYTALLLFFKFYDDLFGALPTDIQGLIPEPYRWQTLKRLDPRGFSGYHPTVLIRFREFFEEKKWRGRKTYGTIFENFQFDIKHDEVLGRALLALDRINFAGMAYDQKGDLYEFLIAKMADAGVKGEFFTPRAIVNMVIDVLAPRISLRIWDPACGTGGFLSRAFEEMLTDLKRRHNERSKKYNEELQALRADRIYGNETEAVSARLARMNMILRGDGHSSIVEFNSLDQQTYTQKRLEIRGVKESNPLPSILEEGGFDLIMANPPYGGSQAVCDVGSHFKPWQTSRKPEANFLQVMMAALKPGGSCGVLMPEGVLFRREEKRIRERLLRDFDLQAIVGLFKGAFEFADVKACVLFFRRPQPSEKWKGTREVWIADTASFHDIAQVPNLLRMRAANEIGRPVPVSEIQTNGLNMMISKYRPKPAAGSIVKPLSGLIVLQKDLINPADAPDKQWPVYGVNNRTGVELSEQKLGRQFKSLYQRVSWGDFIYNPTRIHVGSVGRMYIDDAEAITSPEYVVFKTAPELDPSYLLYLMKTDEFRTRAALVARGSIKHRLYFECLEEIELPIPHPDQQNRILDRLNRQQSLVDRSNALLDEIYRFNWLDDSVFSVAPSDALAKSFKGLVEDVTEFVDPSAAPNTVWQLFSLTNVDGVIPGEQKRGSGFTKGRKYKRIVPGAIAYDTRRINVGSVGIMPPANDQSIISPYRVVFRCTSELDPLFVFYLLKSPYFREKVRGSQVGAIRDELFFTLFTEIPVLLPTRNKQREIVQSVQRQLDAYEQVKTIRSKAHESMKAIFTELFIFNDTEEKAELMEYPKVSQTSNITAELSPPLT